MSFSGLKKSARSFMRQNAPKLFLVTLIYLIVITLLPMLSSEVSGANDVLSYIRDQTYSGKMPDWGAAAGRYRAFGGILAFAIALFTPVINVGFTSYGLKISRGKPGDYKDLLDGFMMFWKILALTILIGIFTFLWSLLFIIPGIVAAYRYSQAYFIMLDNPDLSALECIRESKRLMAGNKLDLFLLNLSFIGWIILSVIIQLFIVLPVINLWLQPYFTLTTANFYNQLIRYTPETAWGDNESIL